VTSTEKRARTSRHNGPYQGPGEKLPSRKIRIAALGPASFVWLGLTFLSCYLPTLSLAQSRQFPIVQAPESAGPGSPEAAPGQQAPDPQSAGAVTGTVVDASGAAVAGARIALSHEGQPSSRQALSGDDGQFSFAGVEPGPFELTIAATGFAAQTCSGTLRPGELNVVPQITLALAPAVTDVQVVVPRIEVAEDQIKVQEKQRVLGFVPNFYVSYIPDAAPLAPKQKFELAWKTMLDPFTFGLIGAVAGAEQAKNVFSAYGQGARGYARRYGAAFADNATGLFIGDALLPSLLKQDPRYFYKGTGGLRSRILHAIASSVMCNGDSGRRQVNYSSVFGSLAASGLSNLYYPAMDRNGAALTFETTAIEIGESAAYNLFQEFLGRKVTPKLPNHDPGKP
jgi:hypothetical protein